MIFNPAMESHRLIDSVVEPAPLYSLMRTDHMPNEILIEVLIDTEYTDGL